MMTIEFSDSEYRWTYGHGPRGRGGWWFFFEGHEFFHCGTYSEAKKACREYIKSIAPADYTGHVIVKVGT